MSRAEQARALVHAVALRTGASLNKRARYVFSRHFNYAEKAEPDKTWILMLAIPVSLDPAADRAMTVKLIFRRHASGLRLVTSYNRKRHCYFAELFFFILNKDSSASEVSYAESMSIAEGLENE
jgi:hypothetical protein